MKFVLNKEETAEALGMTTQDFERTLDRLYTFGFPKPVSGLNDRWPIIAVMNWVNREAAEPVARPAMTRSATSHLSVVNQSDLLAPQPRKSV